MGFPTGRSANTVVLLKHFTYEMMNLTKSDGATFDNDATESSLHSPTYAADN
jgi:hypothetical protein